MVDKSYLNHFKFKNAILELFGSKKRSDLIEKINNIIKNRSSQIQSMRSSVAILHENKNKKIQRIEDEISILNKIQDSLITSINNRNLSFGTRSNFDQINIENQHQ